MGALPRRLPSDPPGFPTLAEEAKRWLERRKLPRRSARDDASRWKNHLDAAFGSLRPAEVDAGKVRAFIEDRLRAGLNPATVGHCVRLLSTFFSDLCERSRETGVSANPVRTVPRSARRLMKPTHDPRRTPFLHELRPGRRSGRTGAPATYMRPQSLAQALRRALKSVGLPEALTWYQATRYTFASQWAIGGGSLDRLALILGHSSTEVTRRYAHLLPDHLGAADWARLAIQLVSEQQMGSGGQEPSAKYSENTNDY